MGITNYLIFDNIDSRDYGIEVFFQDVDHTPKRVYSRVEVAGRNGAVLIDENRYEDVPVMYDCVAVDDADRKEFVNALASKIGYFRLQDGFNPDQFYAAVFEGDVDPNLTIHRESSTFSIAFTRYPQRWLTDGETEQTMGEWSDTETATGDIVTIDNPDGLLAVKSLTLDMNPIQDLNGYDKPWAGGSGANKWDEDWEQGSIGSGTGTNTDSSTAIRSKNYIPVTSGETYYAVTTGTNVIDLRFYDANQTYLGSSYARKVANVTFTVPSEASYMRFAVSNYGTTYNHNIAINYPSTVTTYSPYSNICPISGRSEVVTSVSGKNLLEITATDAVKGGVSYTINADGSITANGTASGWNGVYKNVGTVNLKANVEYILSTGSENIQATYYVDLLNGTTAIATTQYANVVRFTPTTDMVCTLDVVTYYNKTVENKTLYPMVRVASDSDSTFETHQSTTYTTSLGQTVYGGTLDVVSGELTVTHGYVDLGTLNWTLESGIFRLTTNIGAKVTTNTSAVASFVCSAYRTVSQSEMSGGVDKCIAGLNWGYGVRITDTSYTDATAFKTAMDGVQLVYELATPTTVQLTPQEIELLTGTNHLWSGGEVTLEYGDNPAILYNPTPFDASPLLEVEGYGSIEFNGYSIEIDNAVIGSVSLKDQFSGTFNSNRYHQAVINFDSALLDNGDEFAFTPKIEFTKVDGNNYVDGDWKAVYLESVTHTSDSLTGASTSASLIPSSSSGNKMYNIATQFPEITFNKGTALTYQNTAVFSVTATVNGESRSSSNERFITIIEYDGADTITFSYNTGLPFYLDYFYLYGTVEFSGISGESTKSILGDPTYIDCDLGEAYLIEDGEYVSLNSYIDLGSDLPTLASGANEVTFDNTITDLKIIPRWWIL